MRNARNLDWTIEKDSFGNYSWNSVHVALLMDIRDEIRKLNLVFACHNFQEIPNMLRTIRTNTSRIRARRRTKK